MKFEESSLPGAFIIELERIDDERGFFARSFCAQEFAARGLPTHMPQSNISFNARRGTLRGMHYQADPHGEDKLVRCTAGAIFDVIVDLRAESSTRHRWFGLELSAENRRSLFIPQGFAHGFITLKDDSEVLYMMSTPYAEGAGRGIRWDDPAVGIVWPIAPVHIAERDKRYGLLGGAPRP